MPKQTLSLSAASVWTVLRHVLSDSCRERQLLRISVVVIQRQKPMALFHEVFRVFLDRGLQTEKLYSFWRSDIAICSSPDKSGHSTETTVFDQGRNFLPRCHAAFPGKGRSIPRLGNCIIDNRIFEYLLHPGRDWEFHYVSIKYISHGYFLILKKPQNMDFALTKFNSMLRSNQQKLGLKQNRY